MPRGVGGRIARYLTVVTLVAVAAGACASFSGASGTSPASTGTGSSPSAIAPGTAATEAPRLVHVHITGLGSTGDFGIAFDYPSDWHVVPSLSLASYTNGDASALLPTCCRLNPNQLAVSVTTGTASPVDMGAYRSPGFDVRSVGDWLVVKETMPAQPSNLVDVHTYWMIGRPGPGETIYSVSAIFRGPDLAPLEAEVDAFVDSIRLDPVTAAIPS
jgi:hypothetical protein